jgi:hypothetical protein
MKLPPGHETNLRQRVKDTPQEAPSAPAQPEPVEAAIEAASAPVEAIPAPVSENGRDGKKPPLLIRLRWDLLPV